MTITLANACKLTLMEGKFVAVNRDRDVKSISTLVSEAFLWLLRSAESYTKTFVLIVNDSEWYWLGNSAFHIKIVDKN